MSHWRDNPEIRATLALLAGGGTLAAAGTAGVAASPVLAVGLFVAAALVGALGRRVTDTAWTRFDSHRYVADLWVGFVVAGVVVLPYLDASPGEVQALGGLVGLAGMANYFLRPVYYLVYRLAVRATNVT